MRGPLDRRGMYLRIPEAAGIAQKLAVTQKRVERRPNLVIHRGKKSRFRLAGGMRVARRFGQIVLRAVVLYQGGKEITDQRDRTR